MTVTLISEVFHDDHDSRLPKRLVEARQQGSELAVLPELPLNPWSPASEAVDDDDAEPAPPHGPRCQRQMRAARDAGIGLVGGVIARDESSGARFNTAVVIDASGKLLATYAKTHVPDEPGFREAAHYQQGRTPPQRIDGFSMPIGVQICSDINRPQGSQILAAQGVEVILAPRATEAATVDRWIVVFRAIAMTTGSYVLSVTRPHAERDVLLGGPSIAVDPQGQVIAQSCDPLTTVTLDRSLVEHSRRTYPGYLAVRSDLYAAGWSAIEPRQAVAIPSDGVRYADA